MFGLVASVLDAKTNEQFDDVEKVLAAYPVQVSPGVWKPTDTEKTELNSALRLATGRWLKRSGIKADERLKMLTRILQADLKNVEASLAKVEAHLERQEVAQAWAVIEAVKDTDLASQPTQRGRFNVLRAYVALLNKDSNALLVQRTLADLPTLLSSQRDQRGRLAEGLAALVKREPARGQDALAALVNYKSEPAVQRPYAEILLAALPRRLQVTTDLASAAESLQADCELIRKQLFPDGAKVPEIVRACEAECMLALHQGSALERLGAEGRTPYYHFVRASALANETSPPLPEIIASLAIVIQPELPAELRYAGRAKKAIELLDMSASLVRKTAAELDLTQLFSDPVNQNETQVYQLLRNAHGWDDSLCTLHERSLASLALAAQWMKTDSDPALARELTVELVRSWQKDDKDKGMAAELVFPVYFTCWTAHKDSNTDQARSRAVAVARRMMMLGELPEISLGKQAPVLYAKVLEPTQKLAIDAKNDAFFGDLADFVKTFRDQAWPFVDAEKKSGVNDELDRIYTDAIALNGNVADYFYKRGNVNLEKRPADVTKALADADALARLKASPHLEHGLRGYAYFIKSRQQRTVAAKLTELDNAIKVLNRLERTGGDAADVGPERESSMFLLFSMVHLERGNYSGSVDRKQAFEAAVNYGRKALDAAEKIEDQAAKRSFKERAYQAQGNAYEDLAWMVGRSDPSVNVESNFESAIRSFRAAKNQSGSGTSRMHLARCYYKIVADSDERRAGKSIPRKTSFLNLSRQQVIAEAKSELEEAIKSSELSNKAEAYHWLGRVLQVLAINENLTAEEAKTRLDDNQFHAASEALATAASVAKDNQLSDLYVANYNLAWAEHALLHSGFKSGANPTRKAQAITNLQQRADQLRKLSLESTVAFDPEQEAKILLARGDSMGKGAIAFLEALDTPAAHARKRESSAATRSDIKAMLLRMQQRELVYTGDPEKITQKMAENAFDDARWYGGVPDGMAYLQHKLQLYDQAFEFFDRLVSKDPARKRDYRKWQVSAIRAAIDLDRTHPGVVVPRFKLIYTIWIESKQAGNSLPAREQIEMGKQFADLAKELRDGLEDKKAIREADIKLLNEWETKLRQDVRTLEAASTSTQKSNVK
jgi:hypothetical protein